MDYEEREEAFNKLKVRDMTKHLRLFNEMVKDKIFQKISTSKKSELLPQMRKYFRVIRHLKDGQVRTVFVPKKNINFKIDISDKDLADRFHGLQYPKFGTSIGIENKEDLAKQKSKLKPTQTKAKPKTKPTAKELREKKDKLKKPPVIIKKKKRKKKQSHLKLVVGYLK